MGKEGGGGGGGLSNFFDKESKSEKSWAGKGLGEAGK